MIDLHRDIQSLTDFKRRTAEFVTQMKRTRAPVVLTVNGRAELVVQDAESYQALLDRLDRADAIEGIRRGLEQMDSGEGEAAAEVFAGFRERHGISGG